MFSAATVAAVLALSSLVGAVPTRDTLGRRQIATQSLPFPVSDPFYVVPDNIESYAPGEIIRSRDIEPKTTIGAPLDKTTQIFYRTTDAEGNADGTVATVWSPAVPSADEKLLSYQYAEDALSINCAPSFAWDNESSTNDYVANIEAPVVVPTALNQGWHVVAPDFEGSKSAFIAGNTEGRAALDGIRAAMRLRSLSKPRVALYGYSGGSHATTWTATLSLSYAPELDIVGLANGGVPVDPVLTLDHINKSPDAVLAGAGILGMGNAYSVFNKTLDTELTDYGVTVSEILRDPNECLVRSSTSDKFAGFDFYTIFKSGRGILNRPEVGAILARETLLNSGRGCEPAPVFKFPSFYYHGSTDQTVPYEPIQEYVAQQCAAGANIRFTTFPNQSHEASFLLGLQPALTFLAQALDLNAPKVKCGTDSPL